LKILYTLDIHFNNKQNKYYVKNYIFIESSQSIFRDDIFDPISDKFYWSVQSNTKNDLTTIRNLSWPGYLGFVFQERNIFGSVYFGSGIKNVDLAFYI
jgi:hypothetical protein